MARGTQTYDAVLVIGSEPNHLLHAILTFFTFIWAAVWLGLYLRSRQDGDARSCRLTITGASLSVLCSSSRR